MLRRLIRAGENLVTLLDRAIQFADEPNSQVRSWRGSRSERRFPTRVALDLFAVSRGFALPGMSAGRTVLEGHHVHGNVAVDN